MGIIKIQISDIKDDFHFVNKDGQEIVLIKINKMIKAYSGICPHLGGPLADSMRVGDSLVCPWHKYCFDLLNNQAYSGHKSPWGNHNMKINLKLKEFHCERVDDYLIVTTKDNEV